MSDKASATSRSSSTMITADRKKSKSGASHKGARKLKIYGPYGASIKLPIPQLPWLKVGSDTVLRARATVNPDRWAVCVPFTPFQAVLVAGAFSSANPISLGDLNNFLAFQALFEEYCIVGVELEIRVQASAAFDKGLVQVTVDEADNTPPTSSIAATNRLDLSCSPYAEMNVYRLFWTPSSTADLNWTPTSSPVDFAWIKTFAAPASTFTSAAQTTTVMFTGTYAMNFRQFKA